MDVSLRRVVYSVLKGFLKPQMFIDFERTKWQNGCFDRRKNCGY